MPIFSQWFVLIKGRKNCRTAGPPNVKLKPVNRNLLSFDLPRSERSHLVVNVCVYLRVNLIAVDLCLSLMFLEIEKKCFDVL